MRTRRQSIACIFGYAPFRGGGEPFLGLDDSHYHMVFYAGLRGSEPCHADAVEQGIIDTIKQVIATPIDQDEIEMVLHQIELDKRHIGGDGMPYGLTLLLEGFSTAIHGEIRLMHGILMIR